MKILDIDYLLTTTAEDPKIFFSFYKDEGLGDPLDT